MTNILFGLLNLTGLAILILFLGYIFEKIFRNVDRFDIQDYNNKKDDKEETHIP